MSFDNIESEIKGKMQSSVSVCKEEMSGINAGKADPRMLDIIDIDVYGAKMKLKSLANVNVSPSDLRTLLVSVWDIANVSAVNKAILSSGLNLTPNAEGSVIRIVIPELTDDRRKDLAKYAAKYAENARVSVRNTRRNFVEVIRKMKKDKEISEDDEKSCVTKIQKITDDAIVDIDKLLADKQKELGKV